MRLHRVRSAFVPEMVALLWPTSGLELVIPADTTITWFVAVREKSVAPYGELIKGYESLDGMVRPWAAVFRDALKRRDQETLQQSLAALNVFEITSVTRAVDELLTDEESVRLAKYLTDAFGEVPGCRRTGFRVELEDLEAPIEPERLEPFWGGELLLESREDYELRFCVEGALPPSAVPNVLTASQDPEVVNRFLEKLDRTYNS